MRETYKSLLTNKKNEIKNKLKQTMNYQKFSEKDYQNWCEDYLSGMSSQRIADKYKL